MLKHALAITRIALLIAIPIVAGSEIQNYLDNAPIDNSLRITLLIYMAIVWTGLWTE